MSRRRIVRSQKALFPRLREIREEELRLGGRRARFAAARSQTERLIHLSPRTGCRHSREQRAPHLRCDQRRAQ